MPIRHEYLEKMSCSKILSTKLFKLYCCMQVGDESYESYSAEKEGILSSLARRAKVSKNEML